MFGWCVPGVARCLMEVVYLVRKMMAQGGVVAAAQMSIFYLKVQQVYNNC